MRAWVGLLLLGAIGCPDQNAQQPAATQDPKLPIVVYYTLPG